MIYCFVYYLWVGHNYCYAYLAGFTAFFLLPGESHGQSARPRSKRRGQGVALDRLCFPAVVPRLGASVAQLPVVPVGRTHPQEVPHLDTRSASGPVQKVSSA